MHMGDNFDKYRLSMIKNEFPRAKVKRNTNCLRNTFFIVAIFVVAVLIVALSHSYTNDKIDSYKTIYKPPVILETNSSNVVHVDQPLTTLPPQILEPKYEAVIRQTKKKDARIHFIHIPKCGGTTMTSVLRQIQCSVDPIKNSDCCLNPGFCDWHAMRRCATIQGCINHFPNRPMIFKTPPSIAVFREPISRIISAWFYRGHSPNQDFFQVRPEFKEIHEGKRPKVTFDEYVEMHEYHNIQTRMLGADSFPYRNITVTEETYRRAVEAVEGLFFIGLQEEFDLSAVALIKEMGLSVVPDIKKERDQSNAQMAIQKDAIRNNERIMTRLRQVNSFDLRLYKLVTEKFCTMIKKYPDLLEAVLKHDKVHCKSAN